MFNIQKLSMLFLLFMVIASFSSEKAHVDLRALARESIAQKVLEDMSKEENSSSSTAEKPSLKKIGDVTFSIIHSSLEQPKDRIHLDKESIEEMEQVFKSSPVIAQHIVDHLKDPQFLGDGSYRYAIFVGPPGSGKTTMAQAIAYKMEQEGWRCEFIASGDIIGDKRNQTAVHLRTMLQDAIAKNKRVIVVIDELNELLENTESANHDTSATAKFLWQFLDGQKNNPHFFLIGTMNRDTKLPQPFKNRINAQRIVFHAFTDIAKRREAFRAKLLSERVWFEKDVSDEYLNDLLKPLDHYTGRDLKGLALLLKIIYRKQDKESAIMMIGKKHIEEAINEYDKARTEMEYDRIEETDAEIKERHFVQNALREDIIRNCQKTHVHNNINDSTSWQTMPEECKAALVGVFSDQQRQLANAVLLRSKQAEENKIEDDKKRIIAAREACIASGGWFC